MLTLRFHNATICAVLAVASCNDAPSPARVATQPDSVSRAAKCLEVENALSEVMNGVSPADLTAPTRDERIAFLDRASQAPILRLEDEKLRAAAELLQERCSFAHSTDDGFLAVYPEVGRARNLAAMFRIDAHRLWQRGDTAACVARLAAIIRLSDYLASGDNVILQLVALHVLEMALDAIEDYEGTLSNGSLDSLVATLDPVSVSDPLRAREGLLGDFQMSLYSLQHNLLPEPGNQASLEERNTASDELRLAFDQILGAWDRPDAEARISAIIDNLANPLSRFVCPRYDRYYAMVEARRVKLARVKSLLEQR